VPKNECHEAPHWDSWFWCRTPNEIRVLKCVGVVNVESQKGSTQLWSTEDWGLRSRVQFRSQYILSIGFAMVLGTHDSALLTSIARHALHALYVSKLWLLAKPTLGGAFKVRATLPLNLVLNLT
jgi:hypothetical protein